MFTWRVRGLEARLVKVVGTFFRAAKPANTPATPPKAATPAAKLEPSPPVKPASGSGQTTPRNVHLAGKTHPKTGVPFDKDGYPDFRAAGVVKEEVKIKFSGDPKKDIQAANDAAENFDEFMDLFHWATPEEVGEP